MKLSAAIRIGSMTTKQIGHHFSDNGNGRCAIGAAIDACEPLDAGTVMSQAFRLFPILNVSVPEEGNRTVAGLIVSMNDHEGYTRDEIADRVEQIEDALEHDGYLTTGVTESKPLELIAQEK